MRRWLALVYGLVAWLAFMATMLYLLGFLAGLAPRSVDTGAGPLSASAVGIDVLLLGLFGVQHSVMARPAFKRWWTRAVPAVVERSTYVLVASVLFALAMWEWQAIGGVVWSVREPVLAAVLWGLFGVGFAVALAATFSIDHFGLFGVRQVWAYFGGRAYEPPPFQVQNLYRFVRHPLMLGLLMALWCAPVMTLGHLLFSSVTTLYVAIGVFFEERDLVRHFPDRYPTYQQEVPAIFPSLRGPAAAVPPVEAATGDR